VPDPLLTRLCEALPTLLGAADTMWEGQAWYSLVTLDPSELTPIQRLPHFDGFDEEQVAVMIYLNRTAHGGTGFYRQEATGFERVTEERYPAYKGQLETHVAREGLPTARYPGDGEPFFSRTHAFDAEHNSLIVYPGVALHSGQIDNTCPLSEDPSVGRLTINGFFRPQRR